ncbi:MAG TPA: tetratricopeptide repeat protein [Ktedonobacteraceae bacterium]|nr:tetratricopeptide repeat protein [Ktedonobacteraceae bacterium]
MPEPPTGTITFLFTDIEGSTVRWEHFPERMRETLERHDTLLRRLMEDHGGFVFKTAGDAFYVAFSTAPEALKAAIEAQRALNRETWPDEISPLRVRMAIHTGAAEHRHNDYFGQPLNHVARTLSAGHGGQILLSAITQKLVVDTLPADITLLDLGKHFLKDIELPRHIFQVNAAGLPAVFPPLKTLDHHPNNLPVQLTPFVGRQHMLAKITHLLQQEDIRLLTLIGPGGIGKTRLGLQAAAQLTDTFPNGIFFVDLSTTYNPDTVLSVISQTLGIKEAGTKPLLERLKELLNGHILLLLDNFEQVTEAAPFLPELLAYCPGLKVLVTSRTALALTGEHEYYVEPLTCPQSAHTLDLNALMEYESIALFIQRARNVKLDFQVTRGNAPMIVEICNRLDALPLAIELAAARIKMLPPQAMLKHLNRRLQLLKDEKRDRTKRQQTLRGAIAWSYDLLNQDEKKLFAQLAVFNGGCTLDAIITVCPCVEELADDPLDVLTSLIDKSLLRLQEREEEEPRFRMLHTIRDFALEQMASFGNEAEIQRRHFAYYLNLAEEAAPALTGTEQQLRLEQLDSELDNLHAALWWAAQQPQSDPGARLPAALWRFWLMRGYLHEGRHWLDTFLSQASEPTITRGRLLEGASVLACRQKDYERASVLASEALELGRALNSQETLAGASISLAEIASMRGEHEQATALFEESLTIRRALGDKRGTASLLNNLGNVSLRQGQLDQAIALFEESQALLRAVGDQQALASVLNNLGEVERRRDNQERANLLYEESLKISRRLKYTWGIAAALNNLGSIACTQGNYVYALGVYKESLDLFHQLGDKLGIALSFEGLAEIAYAQKQLEQAALLLAHAEMLRQSIGTRALQLESTARENMSATLRSALGSEVFESLWDRGKSSQLDEAIAEAQTLAS